MIDVHVLVHSGTRSDWLAQCLESLEGQPCVVHVIEGVEGSVGAGRARGYADGTQPYVAAVDSDDWLYPGAVQACIDALQEHEAVCTLERAIKDGQPLFRSDRGGHHLLAARRSAVEPYLDRIARSPFACDVGLLRALDPVQLPVLGYAWRVHAEQTHARVPTQTFIEELAQW